MFFFIETFPKPVDRNHKEADIPDKNNDIPCPFCNIQVENLDILRKHIQNGHTDNKFKEEHCLKCEFVGRYRRAHEE